MTFKIFDEAGSDLESYPVQLSQDLKANACCLLGFRCPLLPTWLHENNFIYKKKMSFVQLFVCVRHVQKSYGAVQLHNVAVIKAICFANISKSLRSGYTLEIIKNQIIVLQRFH